MSSAELYDLLAVQVASLPRAAMIERLARFPGHMRLDFSQDYLNSCGTDQLRHLVLAALWRDASRQVECR
jgi:hypothetical protein